MFAELGISEDDWQQTPQAVRTVLAVVWQQNRFLMSRCTVYETQVERRQTQVAELEILGLEVAELRERLGRNSQNSSLRWSRFMDTRRIGCGAKHKALKRTARIGLAPKCAPSQRPRKPATSPFVFCGRTLRQVLFPVATMPDIACN